MSNLRIISNSNEAFNDRREAGRLLAEELLEYKDRDTVVLGILHGGIIIADEISSLLGSELDAVLSRKLGAPGNPELAIGAVSEDGNIFLNEDVVSLLGVNKTYIEKAKKAESTEIERRVKFFRAVKPKTALFEKTAIVTDDGAATGATMQAALWSARSENPAKVIAALPVASEDALYRLAKDADEVICLKAPYFFNAVGQFYNDFHQIDDEEALEILKKINKVN